MRIIRGLFI